jgi:hypothetical protein
VRALCQREADKQRELKRQAEIKAYQEKLAAMGGAFWELLVGRGYVDDVMRTDDEYDDGEAFEQEMFRRLAEEAGQARAAGAGTEAPRDAVDS